MSNNIIFIPGISYNCDMFAPVVADLEREFKCYCFIAENPDIEGNLKALDLVCSSDFIIVAHSAFSGLALAYAAQYPGRVKKIVVFGACVHYLKDVAEFLRSGIEQIESGDSQDFKQAMRTSAMGDNCQNATKVADSVIQMQSKTTDAVLYAQVKYYLDNMDLTAILAKVQAQVLVVHNQHDAFYDISESEYIVQHLQHAKLVLAKNVGHLGVMEDPQQFIKIIHNFLG